jgi:hypothetical protein
MTFRAKLLRREAREMTLKADTIEEESRRLKLEIKDAAD